MKEEKVLLQAQESGKTKDQIEAIKTIIDNCTFIKVNVDELPSFDLEYIFLNIRSKSVGRNCQTKSKSHQMTTRLWSTVEVDLSKVNVHVDDGSHKQN